MSTSISADVSLPPEVEDALSEHEETSVDALAALGMTLAAKRKEAVDARKESGIEDVWLKAEESYLGIDEMNRGSFAGARWAKPATMAGAVTTNATRTTEGDVKSDAFVKITSRYVDAGAAKLSEILLPANEKAFEFTSTPTPVLIGALKDYTPAVHDGVPLTQPAPAPATPGAAAALQGAAPQAPTAATPPAAPGSSPAEVPVTRKDVAEETIDIAQTAAKKAETRIAGWMVKSQFRAETRKVIHDSARLGVGVLKGPFPRNTVHRALDKTTKTLQIISKVEPAYEWKSPWNIYPDPACGENVHDGDHIFEVEPYSRKQLRKLKSDPGYIASAIDKVLEDGPDGTTTDPKQPTKKDTRHRFMVWHFYGTIKKSELDAADAASGQEPMKTTAEDVYAICTMVNDTVIRATINPLDSGEFPYHSVPWQRRADHWAGVGIGEQIEMPQRAINAAIRAMFNNAGKSSGSVIVIDQGSITPADKSWVLTPDKIFLKAADASIDDVRKAFAFFQVPNTTPQLMSIIDFCLKLAEEVTNIPLVTQGQSGTTTPETYGATQLQNNNANQLLRSIGYAFDDYITEPVVNQSYEYLLLDPSVPEEEKGDWTIDAHGSVAMIDRAIEDDTIRQMGQFAINPAYGVNPKRWFAEFSKTKHLNPKNFQYTAEEQAKIDSQPATPAPAVQVAQIKSGDADKDRQAEAAAAQQQANLMQALQKMADDTKKDLAAVRKQVDEMRIQRDTDRDTQYVQAQTARDQTDAAAKNKEIDTNRELAIMEYANKHALKLEDVRAQLADTAARLQTEKQLAMLQHEKDLHIHHNPVAPPVQVPGKAPDGHAFAQV